MPFLFLSPSVQEFNPYVTSGNEEYWMNLLADEMEPYLRASGINVTRNDPSQRVSAAIRLSNAGNYGLHLALHSNAAPEALAGRLRGVDLYYYPGRAEAQRAADLLRETLEVVYPLPEEVRTVTSTSLAEVRDTRAPSVLAELGYHDNVEDAKWIEEENPEIARALTLAVTEFFELPFLQPGAEYAGIASQGSGNLNLRGGPGVRYPIIGKIPRGARVQVISRYGDWLVVGYGGTLGYVRADYIRRA
ncbi:MAG: N-acetylmuramoyl-L-alanine amidase [Oscillospiraceae bacterium]|nr:N-acetylmuramoyl-L-alanine amidase [Oscillospiraceae bacterium]